MGSPPIRVLLVHGIGRTPLSMAGLARELRRTGFATRTFGYVAALHSFDRIVDRLRAVLAAEPDDRYLVIGHSLGGLLLRAAIAALPPDAPRPRRLIMLGTPNRSPLLARRFARRWWYRLLNGDAGELLADELRVAGIAAPGVPVTIVAGTRGITGRWSPFDSEPNDGIVAVDETRLGDGAEWIALPVRHPFMMNDRRVRALVRDRCRVT